MTANKENSAQSWVDPDEIPDLTGPEWDEAFKNAKVQRGRPKALAPKISTTIRLSPDVIEHFKKGGPGWQSRIDEALRKVAGL
ncbi:hypothetical protein T281_17720 [Rhodomicrobium udaipurense JA643]|uniref:BrnA antitoxin family protein n=1 Tax=Rhodomicrobium udaipurense TaxID=1202716 RepID=A0A8I1GEW4_9HYPH|nr:BrnA antitoxin family protein [Rhodomicrobium udaipurense]KAI93267.1 hypothetical protein T281_17720 [Rhodomicrobium udaipurense JA643]MBJ7543278.1 BrnA antitoxin family protein [Rhodomicrobium udaipurense]